MQSNSSCIQLDFLTNNFTMRKLVPSSDLSVLVVVMTLIAGFFYLAIVDPSYRQPFADLTKVAVGGYLAIILPPSN
jgi:hypothetical protein